jgi:hypothetical protein
MLAERPMSMPPIKGKKKGELTIFGMVPKAGGDRKI